jgi:major membrane immunogen (membrane-anchored lipoprotein)
MTAMNRFLSLTFSIVFLAISVATVAKDPYIDGTYKGQSRSHYIDEPFYGTAVVTIKNGEISKIDFSIKDTSKDELFDGKYEKHFIGNEEYTQQCRKDWKGVLTYPNMLVKEQDFSKVDAMSGATWSYNIFKASVEDALKNARHK